MTTSHHVGEELELFTREEAIRIAREEAKRDYVESEDVVSSVAYISDVEAYCHLRFLPHEGMWLKTFALLTPSEWLPGEEIQDHHILAVAESGNMVSAVRLYRAKYGVGLKEGLVAVQRLVSEGPGT